jgi:hypothetical protein
LGCEQARRAVEGIADLSEVRPALTSLLLRTPRAGVDLALLGALGVLVGVALATSAEDNG